MRTVPAQGSQQRPPEFEALGEPRGSAANAPGLPHYLLAMMLGLRHEDTPELGLTPQLRGTGQGDLRHL